MTIPIEPEESLQLRAQLFQKANEISECWDRPMLLQEVLNGKAWYAGIYHRERFLKLTECLVDADELYCWLKGFLAAIELAAPSEAKLNELYEKVQT